MPSNPRSRIVNEDESGYYHCVNRCVRRAFLCGVDPLTDQDHSHRKKWFIDRLFVLSEVFLVDIGSYAVMDNHFHLNVRLRPDLQHDLSDEDVLERWWKLFPPKIKDDKSEACSRLKKTLLSDEEMCKRRRKRISSLSWFMKSLTEFIARKANKEDGVTGRFWQGRFYSQPLLDFKAVLDASVYIDLNPIKAGKCENLEQSHYTSIHERISQEQPRFLASLPREVSELQDQVVFMPIIEEEYIEIVKYYAEIRNKEKVEALRSRMSLKNTVVGSEENCKLMAKKMGKKWVRRG